LELLNEIPSLDAIITPVGGGGLTSGVCIAAKSIKSTIRVFAGEPLGADDAARSLAAGRLILQTAPQTIADGLLTSLGDLTWPVVRDHVERIVTVSDDATIEAMRFVWQRAKLMIEPSAAVAVAAVLSDEFKGLEGVQEVGVILSGGNVDLNNLPW
jgi:threonine dehydratase/serine racemase